ncbi:MFS general substrate transporter [Myriangium duriaei CBS 260.36]|uniref:MFS general substrate transporter n=1 Tax=Myriangium duriaei CBS 260.36 TaxID=1168546 RepID=A0A9P4MH25_9PEZI|nr:MFS general substrate transporter [Myriangium duriaei CBS 260.36]
MPQDIQHVERTGNLPHAQDRAAEVLLQASHSVALTKENNKRVLWKIDTRILPIILAVYFAQFIDKTTITYASLFGFTTDTHLVGHQFSWLGSCVYVAQLVFQPLVAYFLVKLPLAKFITTLTLCWGICLTCMAAATTFKGLLVARIFLGIFEAGVAPAFIALSQMWWRRREQPFRIALWYGQNGVVGMFGSLIAYGIAKIHSPLKVYQIIFLFFGCITVVLAGLIWYILPDSPMTARFLKDDDKLIALERLRDNQQGVESREWKWSQAREAFLDYKTWGWGFMMFSVSVPSGGISTFNTLILKDFGFDSFTTLLFNIPQGAVQLLAILGGAWIVTKTKLKSPVLAFLSIPPIIGCVILLYVKRGPHNKGILLFAYYIISVYPGVTPLVYSWSAANTAGETKKKVTTAILFGLQCTGNIVGPQLYTTAEAPLYRRGLLSNLALFVVLIGLYALQVTYLFFMNKKQERRRVAEGKAAKIQDRSMQEVQARSKDETDVPHAEHAFDDLTDFENSEFVYVY